MIVFIVVLFSCYYQVEELLKPLRLSVANYDRIVNMMEENMNDGLSEKADISADIKMYITYVRTLPDGSGESFFHNKFKFFKKCVWLVCHVFISNTLGKICNLALLCFFVCGH